jgi:hypothetical protein
MGWESDIDCFDTSTLICRFGIVATHDMLIVTGSVCYDHGTPVPTALYRLQLSQRLHGLDWLPWYPLPFPLL